MIIEIPIGMLRVDGDIPAAELDVVGRFAVPRLDWDKDGACLAIRCPVLYRKAYSLNEAPRVWAPDEDLRDLLRFGRTGPEPLYLPGAFLVGAALRDCNLDGAHLAGADLSEAELCGARLVGANLVGANLWRADLSAANLTQADLRAANLIGADLTGAELGAAMLAGAVFTGATTIDGADLTGADLVGVCWLRDDVPVGWERCGDRLVRPTDRRAGQRCRVCLGVVPLGVTHQCPGSDGAPSAQATHAWRQL